MHVVLSEAKDLRICLQGNTGMLRGVYPERTTEVLRFAQDDMRRVQHDRIDFFSDVLMWGSGCERIKICKTKPISRLLSTNVDSELSDFSIPRPLQSASPHRAFRTIRPN